MSRPRRGLTVWILAIIVLGTLVSSTFAAPSEKVFVQQIPGPERDLFYRPHVFYLSADGTLTLTGVRWRDYGGPTATAIAIAHTNNCIPFCLAGTFSTHRTKLRLTGRTYCRVRDREIYTGLRLHILGNIPKNFGNGRESLSMRPVDLDGDPLC